MEMSEFIAAHVIRRQRRAAQPQPQLQLVYNSIAILIHLISTQTAGQARPEWTPIRQPLLMDAWGTGDLLATDCSALGCRRWHDVANVSTGHSSGHILQPSGTQRHQLTEAFTIHVPHSHSADKTYTLSDVSSGNATDYSLSQAVPPLLQSFSFCTH